jgi:hypothetical protein
MINVVTYIMVWFGLIRFSDLKRLDRFEMVWVGYTCHLDQKLNYKLKTRVHILKFQRIWIEFVRDVLEWQSATLCKLPYLDPHVGPTLTVGHKTKSSRSHFKTSTNLTEICWKWLIVRIRYCVQIIIPRSTCGPHVESQTLKLKARVHTLKIQWNCLKFVGDVLERQSATMCKLSYLDPHVGPTSRVGP